MDLVDRCLMPTAGETARYLHLPGEAFADLAERQRSAFLGSLVEAAARIADHELGVLFESEWRARLTASWLVGVGRRSQFRTRIGELLLESRDIYAGQGYCFALARLGTSDDAEILAAYLDRYLRLPDCWYDQHWAIGALLHLDDRLGTQHATPFLQPGGLWQQWAKGGPAPTDTRQQVDRLCALVEQSWSDAGVRGAGWDPTLLCEPWQDVLPEQRSRLDAELRAEVGPGHVLEGRSTSVIARCGACDHVFAHIDESPPGWAIVHLTWSGRPDRAPWPRTAVFTSIRAATAELAGHQH